MCRQELMAIRVAISGYLASFTRSPRPGVLPQPQHTAGIMSELTLRVSPEAAKNFFPADTTYGFSLFRELLLASLLPIVKVDPV